MHLILRSLESTITAKGRCPRALPPSLHSPSAKLLVVQLYFHSLNAAQHPTPQCYTWEQDYYIWVGGTRTDVCEGKELRARFLTMDGSSWRLLQADLTLGIYFVSFHPNRIWVFKPHSSFIAISGTRNPGNLSIIGPSILFIGLSQPSILHACHPSYPLVSRTMTSEGHTGCC